jgi:uncharacterized protein (DUF4415 family)
VSKRRIYDISDAEEARIQAGIDADPDNPELTDEQFAQMRPFAEVYPELLAQIERSRGRPRLANPKEAVTLRLSPETIAKFRASGPNWRARMTDVLENVKDVPSKR